MPEPGRDGARRAGAGALGAGAGVLVLGCVARTDGAGASLTGCEGALGVSVWGLGAGELMAGVCAAGLARRTRTTGRTIRSTIGGTVPRLAEAAIPEEPS